MVLNACLKDKMNLLNRGGLIEVGNYGYTVGRRLEIDMRVPQRERRCSERIPHQLFGFVLLHLAS